MEGASLEGLGSLKSNKHFPYNFFHRVIPCCGVHLTWHSVMQRIFT